MSRQVSCFFAKNPVPTRAPTGLTAFAAARRTSLDRGEATVKESLASRPAPRQTPDL